MATKSKTTKRELGDLVSGKPAKTAKAQIKETVQRVRAERAAAHDARMEECTVAAEKSIDAIKEAVAAVSTPAAAQALTEAKATLAALHVEIKKVHGVWGRQAYVAGAHVGIVVKKDGTAEVLRSYYYRHSMSAERWGTQVAAVLPAGFT
jgi:hypothetical protein